MTDTTHVPNFLLCFCVFGTLGDVSSKTLDSTEVLKAAENLIRHFSAGGNESTVAFTPVEFEAFLESTTSRSSDFIKRVLGECEPSDNCTRTAECPGTAEIFTSYGSDGQLTPAGFINAVPVALNTLTSTKCSLGDDQDGTHKGRTRRPTIGEAWGYSIAFATSVVIISNIGVFLGPIMERRFFKRIIQFLVAMGAGALTATALLVLIPEAFDVIAFEELQGYVWKSSVAVISICFFFCSERALKVCLNRRKKAKAMTRIVEDPRQNGKDDMDLTPLKSNKGAGHGHSHFPSGDDGDTDRQPLAWMVMAGDVIHNFVDGLSVGAAFTEDFTLGISISLAVLCEELPHELADIAILLHSGLSIRKALFINFLSACSIYLGLVLGILLGSMIAAANRFIFAVAGALFLYVPLVDMLPDMSAQLDMLIAAGSREARIIAALHAFGLMLGVGIMIFIVNVSPYIAV